MEFKLCFENQLKMHPSMQYRDAVKLCYQAAFGAEHLLLDTERARNYLYSEFESALPTNEPLYEQISPEFVRINLGAWKREELSAAMLFDMLVGSASPRDDAKELFSSYLFWAEQIMAVKMPLFDRRRWLNFLDEYKAAGMPPIQHSKEYKEKENPHYRVVLWSFYEKEFFI